MRSELQSVLNSLVEMERDQLPQLLGELETIRATALLKMSAPASLPQHDELLDAKEAADRLGFAADYLYRHAEEFPFTRRVKRNLRFSSLGIDRYIQQNRGQ
jgi:hypothetical protein